MTLIVLLFSLALERYLNVGAMLKRFFWFEQYLNFLHVQFSQKPFWRKGNGTVAMAFVVFPLPIAVAFMSYLLEDVLNGLVSVLINVFVLLYCLGPEDLYQQVKAYTSATAENREVAQQQEAQILGSTTLPSGESQLARSLTHSLLWQINERVFGVLLWFVLLGPLGAVFYRMVVLLRQSAARNEGMYVFTASLITKCQDALDWLPTRLFSLGYALAGNFTKAFAYWIDNVISGTEKNHEMLVESGLIAMELSEETAPAATLQESTNLLAMFDRVLIVFLVVVAIFTLGSWLY